MGIYLPEGFANCLTSMPAYGTLGVNSCGASYLPGSASDSYHIASDVAETFLSDAFYSSFHADDVLTISNAAIIRRTSLFSITVYPYFASETFQ